MSDEVKLQFVDTNILVYAHDLNAGEKRIKAAQLLEQLWISRAGCLSIQVLQEFYVNVTRKVKFPLSSDIAAQVVNKYGAWKIHSPLVIDITQAITLQNRYQLSFWDAMIVCSAQKFGCRIIWSEDLNNGQIYLDARIVNPFIGNETNQS